MTINHDKKLIFIHVPKNAGTSIIRHLGGFDVAFLDNPLEEYKKKYKEYWNEYVKFSVIRNPIDRFISAYKFARMNESSWFSSTGSENLQKHVHFDLCRSIDINQYCDYLYSDVKNHTIWTLPQSFFIYNKNNEIEVDFLVRYENLNKDLKIIGIDKIEKVNSSEIDDLNLINITENTKKKIYRMYNIDYKNFNYPKNTFIKYY